MPKIEAVKISGFKNLDNFEVSNMKKINYFIGASGAGKSSAWELVTMLLRGNHGNGVTWFGDLRQVIPSNAIVEMVLNDGMNIGKEIFTCSPSGEASLNVNVSAEGYQIGKPDIQYFSSEVKERAYQVGKSKISTTYDPTNYSNPVETALFEITDRYEGSVLTEISHITRGNNESEPTILRGPRRNEAMSSANMSGGYSALVSLAAAIQHNLGSIIVLEEPENGMHVTLQKSLHQLFSDLTKDNDSVQLIVITHSPYLLGAIEEGDTETNTYLVNEGKTLKSDGYDAKGARFLAAKLVGVSFEDIAPTKIIVCEGSLATLLSKVNDRFYYSPVMITSAKGHMGGEASGDEDLLTLLEVEDVYKNRFNFFSKADLIFIIDKLNEDQSRQRQKVDKLLANKDTNLIELSETKLEDHYTSIEGLSGHIQTFIHDAKNNSKKERAALVGESITKQEFERVFPGLAAIFT